MTKMCFLSLLLFAVVDGRAQFYDNFLDGDYIQNPGWNADPEDFIINDDHQLQSANSVINSTFQITTNSAIALNAQWEFGVMLAFNTSSVNYTDIWLISAEEDVNKNSNAGYFVRLGGTDDNISLYKKRESQSPERIITGVRGVLNSSSSGLKIKVIRTAGSKWILLRDLTGSGEAYRSEGEITDSAIDASSFFGISIRQSTASFFHKHFFYDFVVQPFEEPALFAVETIKAVSDREIQIIFNHPLQISSAADILNYHVNTTGTPTSAMVDSINGRIVHLTFDNRLEPNATARMIIDKVSDVYGSEIHDFMTEFTFFKASRYEVVINEIFADPSPQIGLPPHKFIELKNTSSFPVNLYGWQIRDEKNSATLPDVELLPDRFLIITTTTGLNDYKPYGTSIAVPNFPSMNIAGGELSLCDHEGKTIHAVRYNTDTYRNELKKEGGFALEMIDAKPACLGNENWIASKDISGGTPGKKNSAEPHELLPADMRIRTAIMTAPDTLAIYLSGTVDSLTAVAESNYIVNTPLQIRHIDVVPPFFDIIKISFATPVENDTLNVLKIAELNGCGDADALANTDVYFGITGYPAPGDIVINEILSDPKTAGSEYIELYNNSGKVFDLNKLFVANRNSAGELSSITRISEVPFAFLPSGFVVITKTPESVKKDYPVTNSSTLVKMKTLPSFPNDKGFVILSDHQGNILDEIDYDKSWHFQLIKDKKGVSLERISYEGPSDASNFHSAASDVGYGTPGVKNSQSLQIGSDDNFSFSVVPEIFSPDNDGTDDFVTIRYSYRTPGFVTNIRIFDAAGRSVRFLQKNSLSGLSGYYRWDGLDDKNQKLPQGIYIIHLESFNEAGRKIIHKKTVVLARKL